LRFMFLIFSYEVKMETSKHSLSGGVVFNNEQKLK
jgi:hypothetical protein